ncbi:SAM-dependent methyltransferase [Streptomyces sp. NPDC089799]|uniref:class I SAM-dependent methyltransferase n=1 Tax=Streptomyces sp. NPDC089799 TaxID=3155066 RepID=UPI003431245A
MTDAAMQDTAGQDAAVQDAAGHEAAEHGTARRDPAAPDPATEAVKETGFITAVIRALENERPDPYLTDRHAELLSTPVSRAMAAEALDAGGTVGSVIVRGRFGDIALSRAVAGGITQVVCLAAGSDTRAWRLGLPAGTAFFEVDLPGQLEAKEELLEPLGEGPSCRRIALGADLRDGTWPGRLRSAGLDPYAPTAWIVEGLLPYLRLEHFTRLLTQVRELSAPGSVLLIDAPHADYFTDPANETFLAFMKSRGSAFRLGLDDFGGFLRGHGWEAEAHTLHALAEGACPWLPTPPARLCPPRDHHWLAHARLA